MGLGQRARGGAGLLSVFCSSASLLIQEYAAVEARLNLEDYFGRVAPEDSFVYSLDDDAPDDNAIALARDDGRMMLGTWQGIFLLEDRRRPTPRHIALHLVGE